MTTKFEPIDDLDKIPPSRDSLYDGSYLPGDQNQSSIEYVALPGGGVAGAAFGGVVKEFEERGYRRSVKYWAGSSAGAICSSMAAMGAPADYMIEKLVNTDKTIFLDFGGQPQIKGEKGLWETYRKYRYGITELLGKLGTARGTQFQRWFENAMYEVGWNPDTTFADLYNKTGRHLCVTATSLNTFGTLYFSRSSYPHLKISDAVHVSMSLPFIFQPTLMKDPSMPMGDRYLSDGAILDSLPLNVFDPLSPTGEILAFNRRAVGFTLVSDGKWVPDYVPVDGLTKYALTFISGLRNRINIFQSHQPYFWNRVVPIESYGVDSVDFDAGPEAMKRLVQSGQESTKLYLDRREAMIGHYGPLPGNLFIPNHRLRTQGVEYISNDFTELMPIYQTNPEKFAMNQIPATENYHLWS